MSNAILVLNAGSSSIKFSVFPGDIRPNREALLCDGECEGIGDRLHFMANDRAGKSLGTTLIAVNDAEQEACVDLLASSEAHVALLCR